MKNIVTIGGDGIGPEVVGVTKEVLQTLFPDTFAFTDISAGYDHFLETGETISEADLQLCREADAVLYGANTNPAGDSKYSSLTLTLRQELGLYANVRPAKSLPGIGRYENVDLVVVRENSEGMYIREEERIPHGWVAKRRITEGACERILTYAFELALTLRKSRVTLVHKANVLRHTCGLFRKIGFELAAEYPDLTVDERFVDAMAMELVMRPEEFQVIVTTNLFGDILSDEASGLVGGLGVAPGANIGNGTPVFEPVHGSAPDIAGKGVANPLAMILSAQLMLEHLQLYSEARELEQRVMSTLRRGAKTVDIGGTLSTTEFIQQILTPPL